MYIVSECNNDWNDHDLLQYDDDIHYHVQSRPLQYSHMLSGEAKFKFWTFNLSKIYNELYGLCFRLYVMFKNYTLKNILSFHFHWLICYIFLRENYESWEIFCNRIQMIIFFEKELKDLWMLYGKWLATLCPSPITCLCETHR